MEHDRDDLIVGYQAERVSLFERRFCDNMNSQDETISPMLARPSDQPEVRRGGGRRKAKLNDFRR